MTDTNSEVHRLMCEHIQAIAESKLGRPLSPVEQAGIWRIPSLMQLEAIERTFSHSQTSDEDVTRELAFFSTHNLTQ